MLILLKFIKVHFFISRLKVDEREKLYAMILMSKNRSITRKDAMYQARFIAKRPDLERELEKVLVYGPDSF